MGSDGGCGRKRVERSGMNDANDSFYASVALKFTGVLLMGREK